MRSTIDRAGRVVIPASIRVRAGLTPGTALEVTVDKPGFASSGSRPDPSWCESAVARPTVGSDDRPQVDIAALIEEERNRWP